jgi:hypothetical protein
MDTLATDLDAFLSEHLDCASDMAGCVDDQADGSAVVWFACPACEARIVRQA